MVSRLKAAGLWAIAILSILFLTAAWLRRRMAAGREAHRVEQEHRRANAEENLQKADGHLAEAARHAGVAEAAEAEADAARDRLLAAKARAAKLMETIRSGK